MSGVGVTVIISVIGCMMMIIFRMNRMHIEIISRIAVLESKVDVLWRDFWARSHSPIALNKRGREILHTSTFRNQLESTYSEVLMRVRAKGPQSAYEVQEILITVISRYQYDESFRFTLHEDAFNNGSTVEDILFISALSIRDRVMIDLGFDNAHSTLLPNLYQ